MHDMIIIGGGPAAAAAAFYAIDKQLDVLMVYEDLGGKVGQRESMIGYDTGTLGSATRRYVRKNGRDVAELIPSLPANAALRLLISHAMHSCHVRHDRVVRVQPGDHAFAVETGGHGVLHAKTVIMATGATPRELDVPGAAHVIDRGMDYSITTYAQHTRGQQVAVIGGTTRALLGAAELSQVAAHVFVIIPDRNVAPTPLSNALLQQHNLTLISGYDVAEVTGDHTIESLILRTGSHTRQIFVQRAFVDLGLMPNSELVRSLGCTDENGFIIVDCHMATPIPGLFAAGDVTTAAGEQVLIAIGDGARAAKSAHTHLLTRAVSRAQERARTAGSTAVLERETGDAAHI